MAILRGFPPSNTISPGISIPDLEGEAVVISTRDPLHMGRVLLDFGTWAEPGSKRKIREGVHEWDIPSKGTKVKWTAFSYQKKFWYHWKHNETKV